MKTMSIIQVILLQGLLFCATASAEVILGENPDRAKLQPPELSKIRGGELALPGDTKYVVRIIYLIPSNRTPQADAEKILQKYGLRVQGWFREHMERLGFGPKSFEFETEADGIVPKVNMAHVAEPDTYFHDFDYGAQWGKILGGIASAGFPSFQPGEVFLVIAETHIQQAGGSFLGSSVFFGGAGLGDSGVGVVTGETLARMPGPFLIDDRPYNGLTIPTIGSFPLVASVTFPSYEGTTISSTSSSAQGGAAHELGHGFGLSHDFRNDGNFNGNLLGNGFRGLRGVFYPERYPNDDVRLSSASALQLNNNRFFNARHIFTDNIPPVVNILTSGTVIPQNGLFQVKFTASENQSSLAGAVLLRNGEVVADMQLSGNFVEKVISTYLYDPGVTYVWEVIVYDTEGNRVISNGVELAVASGVNRAPIPSVRFSKTRVKVGEEVILNAGGSSDPDGPSSLLRVEWDLDGDGLSDTTSTTAKEHKTSYSKPGVIQVTARLTDINGNVSESMPIGVRVDPPVLNDFVSFVPIGSTFSSTDEAGDCPSGDFGKLSFEATLKNTTDRELSDLHVEIEELSNDNLLRTEERLLMIGEIFPISRTEDYADGILSSGESVAVPIRVCLNTRKPFRLLVNVLGMHEG
ncbi:MAG: PKD domain-containing protein [Nitrospirales bacterium]